MKNIPPFYIGQIVVAICNHPFGFFKKNDEFSISFIRPSSCKCSGWEVSIGILGMHDATICHKCNESFITNNNEAIFDAARFVPKQDSFKAISLTKILKEELVSEN